MTDIDLSPEGLGRIERDVEDDDGHWIATRGHDVVLALIAALRKARNDDYWHKEMWRNPQ